MKWILILLIYQTEMASYRSPAISSQKIELNGINKDQCETIALEMKNKIAKDKWTGVYTYCIEIPKSSTTSY